MTNETADDAEQHGDKIFVPDPEMIWKHDAALLHSLRQGTLDGSKHAKANEAPSRKEGDATSIPRVMRKRASLPFITEGLHKDSSGRLWAGDYCVLDKMDFKAVGLDISDNRGLFVRNYARTEQSMKIVNLGKLSCAGILAGARQVPSLHQTSPMHGTNSLFACISD